MNDQAQDLFDELEQACLKKAVALSYDGNRAPQISAKGMGGQAQEIVRIAQEHRVPLCDNAALVELLSELELGDEIPKALYVSVAQIIAFAYRLSLADE